MTIENLALFSLSYGLYVLSSQDESGLNTGCVINAVMQTSAEPPTLTVCSHNNNFTTAAIASKGSFTLSVLTEEATMETIGLFGFRSSRDIKKFDKFPFQLTELNLPVLAKHCCAYLECEVEQSIVCYTHQIFVSKIINAVKLSDVAPMTYDYYYKVIKGLTPKNAVSYVKK